MRAWVDQFRGQFRGLADALAPQVCLYCGAQESDRATALPLCDACAQGLPRNTPACPTCALPQPVDGPCAQCLAHPPPQDFAWAPFRYVAPIAQNLHTLKYHAGFLHARLLGGLMARELLMRSEPLPALLLPVPAHRTRLLRRGYNQALEITRAMARDSGIICRHDLLRAMRRTQDQIGKSAAQRRTNVRAAFAASPALAGLHIAVVDDVMTTGATLAELARVCRQAGAARVEVWAAARVSMSQVT